MPMLTPGSFVRFDFCRPHPNPHPNHHQNQHEFRFYVNQDLFLKLPLRSSSKVQPSSDWYFALKKVLGGCVLSGQRSKSLETVQSTFNMVQMIIYSFLSFAGFLAGNDPAACWGPPKASQHPPLRIKERRNLHLLLKHLLSIFRCANFIHSSNPLQIRKYTQHRMSDSLSGTPTP